MNESLRQRWQNSVILLANDIYSQCFMSASADLDAVSSLSNKWLDKVEQLYNETHRAYHNMTHVADVLASLDVLLEEVTAAQECMDTKTCEVDNVVAVTTLAAFFHDVIYNPKSSSNEKDSADLFIEFALELCNIVVVKESCIGEEKHGTTSQQSSSTAHTIRSKNTMISQIEQCIIATATHISSANEAHQSNNILVATFLDADMSILGKGDTATYNVYAGSRRKEYEFVERNVYCEKRAEILESFLPLDAATTGSQSDNNDNNTTKKQHLYIYATERGRELWEDQARQNLKREIDMLRRGVIPSER